MRNSYAFTSMDEVAKAVERVELLLDVQTKKHHDVDVLSVA